MIESCSGMLFVKMVEKLRRTYVQYQTALMDFQLYSAIDLFK